MRKRLISFHNIRIWDKGSGLWKEEGGVMDGKEGEGGGEKG